MVQNKLRVFTFTLFICFGTLIHDAKPRMNEKQLESAVKLVTNMCMGKAKTTPEEILKMHQGDWNIDHNTMCYLWCGLNMYKLMDKDNKFDRVKADAQLHQLPESMHDYVKTCMNQCQDAAVTLDDKCVAAYELAKCMYFCNPEKYFLP